MDATKQTLLNKHLEALNNFVQVNDKYNITLTCYNDLIAKSEKSSTLGSNIIRWLKQEISKIENANNKGHSIMLFDKTNPSNSMFLQCIIPNTDMLPVLEEISKLNKAKIDYKTHILKQKYLAFYNQYITIYDVKNHLG